jgi:hypothetical protein
MIIVNSALIPDGSLPFLLGEEAARRHVDSTINQAMLVTPCRQDPREAKGLAALEGSGYEFHKVASNYPRQTLKTKEPNNQSKNNETRLECPEPGARSVRRSRLSNCAGRRVRSSD